MTLSNELTGLAEIDRICSNHVNYMDLYLLVWLLHVTITVMTLENINAEARWVHGEKNRSSCIYPARGWDTRDSNSIDDHHAMIGRLGRNGN